MERKVKHQRFQEQRAAQIQARDHIPACLTKGRAVTFHTWGLHQRKQCPVATDHDYNAEALTADRQHQGMSHALIMQQPRFRLFAHRIIQDIERHNWKSVSIYCCKGQHRSVAVAEYLHKLYEKSQMKHWEK